MYDFFVIIVTIRLVFLPKVFLVEAFLKVSLGTNLIMFLKKKYYNNDFSKF